MCQVINIIHILYLKINFKSKLHPSRHPVAVKKTAHVNLKTDLCTFIFSISLTVPWFHLSYKSYTARSTEDVDNL